MNEEEKRRCIITGACSEAGEVVGNLRSRIAEDVDTGQDHRNFVNKLRALADIVEEATEE